MKLAPIGLSTYTRLNHLQKMIVALQKNTLAPQSELYIFSDGPKIGNEGKVCEIRNYLKTIDGFKLVKIVERENNYGLNKNSVGGIQSLLSMDDKFVWLEEDIVTAPSFLQYINQALDIYRHNPKIFSISGYCPPIKIPKDYPYDVFLLPRFNAWGFGMWKDRFDLIERRLPKDDVETFINSWKETNKFSLGGLDMLHMLKMENIGKINALDVRIFFLQYKLQMDTIYPVKSLVRNIGFDGSGMHTPNTNYFDVNLMIDNALHTFPLAIERNQRIIKSNFIFRLGQRWFLRPKTILRLIVFFIYNMLRNLRVI